ncbi:MAG TPA: histidine kinase [Streptosporangiaceae bacterium]|jgi:signal transduction histidine kinase|nr:histidine kinase [Streptosporangiaceae bacterium]
MSDRVSAAQAEALRRFRREGRQLAPLRWWVIGIVVLVAATSKPAVGLSGRHLALTISLAVFVVEMFGWPLVGPDRVAARVGELAVFGASAVAIAVFQPNGLSELPGSAVVFIAGVALSPPFAVAIGATVTAGVATAVALGSARGVSVASIAESALLCAVLGLTGAILRRYRISQANTELLLAHLEEARDDQARAAAAEERASIARDLHDVLAHSLSGLSIQLEMVRKLAARADVPPELRAAIDGAAGMTKEGLAGARDAVGVLRRDDQLGVSQLPELVEHFRRDFGLAVDYTVQGTPRPVAPDLGLALYRVTGEALTNVARHAAGASARVELSFDAAAVRLSVTDDGGEQGVLAGEGSGWGLAGVRERIKRLGGDFTAGPAGPGWSVVVSAPA